MVRQVGNLVRLESVPVFERRINHLGSWGPGLALRSDWSQAYCDPFRPLRSEKQAKEIKPQTLHKAGEPETAALPVVRRGGARPGLKKLIEGPEMGGAGI